MSVIATTEQVRDELIHQLSRYGEQLSSPVDDQLLVQVRRVNLLLDLARFLSGERFYLVTVVANDERELEDRRFKIYYMFSHPTTDLFVLVEYLLEHGRTRYPSLYEQFPAVDCFEREMLDMVGLRPEGARQDQLTTGSWLHEAYPPELHPLRRERTTEALRRQVADHADHDIPRPAPPRGAGCEPGCLVLPVGPIHAGIIEPGQFLFTIAGEAIEDLDLRLGYTHRGIERLFQSHLDLLDGWWLAEQVSGDSSFAHSLAYCRAAETLTEVPAPPAAELLRALFLELERIHNHIGDVAALAEDVAMDRLSSDFGIVREQLLRLNKRLTGHRYLRRINRPGGVTIPGRLDVTDLRETLRENLGVFDALARRMKGDPAFRDRTIGVGILTGEQALRLGVTGLVARASGVPRDSRWDHPTGVYDRALLDTAGRPEPDAAESREAQAGDVYARFLIRVDEVRAAGNIAIAILDSWTAEPPEQQACLLAEPRVRPENNYTFACGYAEGFRGDVVYWLMQDKMNGIYRCKVRDPSMLNWPALRHSVLPRADGETVLADFPLVNQSFNLSYAGNDL